MTPTGRAATPEAKRAIVERLLAAWERWPEQRLGQLLVNAARGTGHLFYTEDEDLVSYVEEMTR